VGGSIVRTADAQLWLSLGLVAVWLVVAVVALTGGGAGRHLSRGTLVATGAVAALFAAYAVVVDAVADPAPLSSADGPTLRWMVDHRSAPVTLVMVKISNFGGTLGMTVLTALGVVVLLWRRRFREALVVLVVGAVAGPLVSTYKHLYERQRPPVATQLVAEPSYALPSGHSLSSMAVVGILTVVAIRLLRSPVRRLLVLAAGVTTVVAIGVSRLYLGVHWLTDVLAGWLLGGAWLSLCTAALVIATATPRRVLPSAHLSPTDGSPLLP
jgi:membrane-associated phospholipid phosphatase